MRIEVLASGSKGNCYLIDDGNSKLLLDAGIPASEIRKHVKLTDLAGALITHQHKDHCRAVKDLCKVGVAVYALPDVLQAEEVDHNPYAIPVLPGIRPDGSVTNIINMGDFVVFPFRLEHDVPNIGYTVRSINTGEDLLYLTDTMYIRYRFPSPHYILVECNYCEDILDQNVEQGKINESLAARIRKTHMSLESLREMLMANDLSKLKQIYLLHLSDGNSDAARIKTEIQRLTGCEVYIA